MIIANLVSLISIAITYAYIVRRINTNAGVPIRTLIGEWDLLLISGQLVTTILMFIGVLILSINGTWPRFIPISWELVVMMAIVLFRTISEFSTMTSKLEEKYGKIITNTNTTDNASSRFKE